MGCELMCTFPTPPYSFLGPGVLNLAYCFDRLCLHPVCPDVQSSNSALHITPFLSMSKSLMEGSWPITLSVFL